MPDRSSRFGGVEWRRGFELRLRTRAKLVRFGHFRSVSPGPPRFSEGNQALYLHDGRDHLSWILAAIGAAKYRVDFEMYIMEADESGTRVRDALADAAKRGVLVRLLYDSIGCAAAGASFFEPISAAGGHVIEFNPMAPWRLRMSRIGKLQHWEPNTRDHRKLLVCDAPMAWATRPVTQEGAQVPPEDDDGERAAIAITGGRNMADVYLKNQLGAGQWRDCGVVMFGPVVKDLGQLFDRMWFHAEGADLVVPPVSSPPVGDLAILAIGSQPGFFNMLQWALARLALVAQQELRISCAYFIPPARWRRALGNVARRTGRCAILVPKASDVPMIDKASRHLWGALLRAGVAIYMYTRGVLHEKTFIYDGMVTVVGSSNIDPRSFRLNYELSVFVVGESFAAPVVARHNADLEEAEPYTLDRWRARPLWQRFTDWLWSLARGQL